MPSIYRFPFALLSLAAAAYASQSTQADIATPVLGFAYDSASSAIRPIHGVPGAALLGAALDLGFPVTAAAISPQQNLALTVSADGQQVRLVRLQGGTPQPLPVNGAMTAPDRMVFSPSGAAAVLFQQASGRLQMLTGLPGAPAIQDIQTGGFAGAPSGIAVSDDGALILLASPGASPLWLLGADGSSIQLPLSGLHVAFRRNSRDAVTITSSGDVYAIGNTGSGATYRQVHAGGSQTSDPVGVQVSPDGTRAYAANAAGALSVFDLSTGSTSVTDCACNPVGIEPLNSGAAFRLNEISRKPLWLFDASAAPRLWFVPPPPTSPGPQAQRRRQ